MNDTPNVVVETTTPVVADARASHAARFNKSMDAYKRSLTATMSHAREAAEIALEHFILHGQLALIQRFYDETKALAKNYGRANAFGAWCLAYAPLKFKANRFEKDRGGSPVQANLEGAKAIPFWDFAPDNTAVVPVDGNDLFIAFYKLLNKYNDETKYDLNDGAEAAIVHMKNALAHMPRAVELH